MPFSAPTTSLKLIVVGEGPGRVEERTLQPFVGPTGKFLDTLLATCGPGGKAFPRSSAYITNAMMCRGESDKDNDMAALCCAPRLLRELRRLDPAIPILVLGKAAAKSVLGVRSIMMARGFVWTAKEIEPGAVKAARTAWEKLKAKRGSLDAKRNLARLKYLGLRGRAKLAGRMVLPSLHPAFIMRADTWKPILQLDMRRALKVASRRKLRLRDNGPYRLVRTAKGFREAMALNPMGPIVSTDIETGNEDPSAEWPNGRSAIIPLQAVMLCVGISDGKHTVVVDPRKVQGEKPIWPRGLVRAMQKFYETREGVVMHNGYNFDQIVMMQYGFDFGDAL